MSSGLNRELPNDRSILQAAGLQYRFALSLRAPLKRFDFLVRAFDAVELRRFPAPDGKLMHAEVAAGRQRRDDRRWRRRLAAGAVERAPLRRGPGRHLPAALPAGATSVQVPVKKDDAESAPSGADARSA